MILKEKDDAAPLLAELERLLALRTLTKVQQEQIEDELWKMRTGVKGEKEAAYHIDFDWKDRANSVVIHDLRIEHGGRVAQIDHLILSRALDCHVIESKAFTREVRISAGGEWEIHTRLGWKGIPSPVEQNRRHIEVLESFVRDRQLAPKRLGLPLSLRFHNWVLVSPECQIRRMGREWERVVKMDMFRKQFIKQVDGEGVLETLASMSKLVSRETMEKLARGLVAGHWRAVIDFAAKFGVQIPQPDDDSRFAPPASEVVKCEKCTAALEPKVIQYCRINSTKLGGRRLCQTCQRLVSRPGCDGCGVDLEDKVIAFCRYNSKRFGGRKLCRMCQRTPVLA